MICPHCGENNSDKAKYCVRCSATLRGGGGIDAKTIIIIVLAAALVIGGVIFAITKVTGGDDSATEVAEETVDDTQDTVEETTEETTEEEDTTEEEEETIEASHSDWFADNGLSLSDASDKFTFTTMKNDGESDTEEMEVSSKITISESTENVADGYKLVKAVFVHDISDSDGDRGIIADGAFDRYTGTFFGFGVEQPEQDEDNKSEFENFVMITDGSYNYDIFINSQQEVNAPIVTKTITICCPKDYDGTVFFAGYDSLEMDDYVQSLDMSARLYTFDELPFMHYDHDMYYFQYNTTDLGARSYWGTYDATTTTESSSEQGPPSR